jgi:phage gp29-like protein
VRSLRTDGQAIPTSAIQMASEPGAYQPIGIQPASEPLAPFKFVVHVAKAKAGLPIRGGLARAAGWAYFFKQYVLKDWVTFAEVYGQPLRVGKYGPGATEQDKEALLRAVANIGTDAAAIIPDSMLIEFANAQQARASADLYKELCTYLDDSVSKAVLGQTLTTQLPRGGGSRAAAQVHESVRRDILAADAKRLSQTITRDLVIPYVQLNHGPQARYPQFWLGLPDDQDMKVFADVAASFIDRGLRVGQRTVLDKLGLPEPDPDEPLMQPAKTAATPAVEDEGDSDTEASALSAAQKKSLRWSRY